MNKERRKQIENIKEQLVSLNSEIESLSEEETDYYDNMPESLQGGEKGDIAQSAIDNLDSAISSIEEALDYLEEAM